MATVQCTWPLYEKKGRRDSKRPAKGEIAYDIAAVSYTHLDVYKRQIWLCLNLRLLSFAIENTLDKKTLQVNYPFPLTDLHQKQ